MKSVIKQVLDLDAQAQQRLQAAYDQREAEMARIDAEAAQKRAELSARREARLQQIYDQEKALCEEELAALAQEEAAARARLAERFDQMEDQWVRRIAAAITG